MSATNFDDLKRHVGHDIVCVTYGPKKDPRNVAVECETCNEVLIDFDKGGPKMVKRDDASRKTLPRPKKTTCRFCGGTGKKARGICSNCDGFGWYWGFGK